MNSSKNLFRILIISNTLCWGVLIFLLLSSLGHDQNNKVLTVERINIVNEDGTTVMAISNKQRIAAPRMNGKEYPVDMIERQHFAGIIFFNDNGDEVGGLIYNSGELQDGRKFGSGHISFDRYNDNQVINLEYKENIHGLVKSGITIYDRKGNGSFGKNLDLIHEYRYDSISDERKEEIINEIDVLKETGQLGNERLFIGSENEIPQLTMKDIFGIERIKLFIDSTNVGKLHFYNGNGDLVGEFTGRK